jgi:hypothetical protein
MCANRDNARAFFLSTDGESLPDTVVCSGLEHPELDRRACLFSDGGRFPLPQDQGERVSSPSPERDSNGELALPCSIMQLGSLDDWQEFLGKYPREVQDLRVFKCKQMLLFVIPGLIEDNELVDTGELVGGM